MGRSPLATGAIALVAACKGKPTTTLTVVGEGPASGPVVAELRAIYELLDIGIADGPTGASELIVKTEPPLAPDDRARLDNLLVKLGSGKVRAAPPAFTVDVDPDPGDPAAKPEHFDVKLDAGGERTLRSTGHIGGAMLCSWEMPIDVSLPGRVTAALWNTGGVTDRPFRIATDDPDLRLLVDHMRFFQSDHVAFVFAKTVEAMPRVFAGTASDEEARACSDSIAQQPEPWFLCTFVFPNVCGWMKSHQLGP